MLSVSGERRVSLTKLRLYAAVGTGSALGALVVSIATGGIVEFLGGCLFGLGVAKFGTSWPNPEPMNVGELPERPSLANALAVGVTACLIVGVVTTLANQIDANGWELGSIGGGTIAGAFVALVLWEVRKIPQ